MAGSSTSSVVAGISANALVSIAKFIGFAFTGSAALLSEAIHSVADTSNQSLLLVGLKRAERPPDDEHPYGYGRDRFFWGLVSALGIFFVGAGVTLYHGIDGLIHPHEVNHSWVTWVVLAISLVLETLALVVAVMGINKDAKAAGVGFMRYVKEGRDPTIIAVLLEDAAAVFGVLIAVVCIALTQLTGNPFWDALASVLVGLLLASIALFLVAMNRRFLITKAIDGEVQVKLREVIEGHATVEEMTEFKAVVTSLGKYRVAADVDFDGRLIADRVLAKRDVSQIAAEVSDEARLRTFLGEFAEQVIDEVGDEIDAIEDKIKKAVPEAVHVELEQD